VGAWLTAAAAQIEAGHLDNPYHNGTHVADVVQSMHVMLSKVRGAACRPEPVALRPPLAPLRLPLLQAC